MNYSELIVEVFLKKNTKVIDEFIFPPNAYVDDEIKQLRRTQIKLLLIHALFGDDLEISKHLVLERCIKLDVFAADFENSLILTIISLYDDLPEKDENYFRQAIGASNDTLNWYYNYLKADEEKKALDWLNQGVKNKNKKFKL